MHKHQSPLIFFNSDALLFDLIHSPRIDHTKRYQSVQDFLIFDFVNIMERITITLGEISSSFTYLVKSKPVKLDISYTVILPLTK